MFSSEFFFDSTIIGAQIKSPIDLICGLSRVLKKNVPNIPAYLASMDEVLIDPPTVEGWPASRVWISTKTFPNRVKFARDIINSMTDDEVIAFIKNYPAYDDAVELVKEVCLHLLQFLPSQDIIDRYTNITLLQNQPVYEWSDMIADKAPAVRGMKALLIDIAKNPAFQLC
jgi:hypothetical protein